MTTTLYSAKDSDELVQAISTINKVKDKMVEDHGAVAINIDSSKMFENIKDIFSQEQKEVKTNRDFFTLSKGKIDYGIDNTIFAPSSLVLLSGSQFQEKYVQQLEGFVFNSQEELDGEKLINIIYLIEFIKKDMVPIRLMSGKYRKLITKITNGMNYFFSKHYATLSSIHVMFTGMSNIPQHTESKEDDRPVQ